MSLASTDWRRVRRECVRDALRMGLSRDDADDVAQEACIRTMGRDCRDVERHARTTAARLASDVLRRRGRAGLTTGVGVTSSRSGARVSVDSATLSVEPTQVEHVEAHEVVFALLVAEGLSGASLSVVVGEVRRMARKRGRDALRAALGLPGGARKQATEVEARRGMARVER